jgi:hypothetical protein
MVNLFKSILYLIFNKLESNSDPYPKTDIYHENLSTNLGFFAVLAGIFPTQVCFVSRYIYLRNLNGEMNFQAETDFEFATITLRNDGIVEFVQKPGVINLSKVKECHAAMDALQVEQPFLLLVIVPSGASATKEAREYAAQESIRNRIKAQAIVLDNVATRIMANFYMKINRPRQPIKIFSDKKQAITWLQKN